MEVESVPRNINRIVKYNNPAHFIINKEFLFAAYTIRKVKGKIFRQAELQDLMSQRSILIVNLEEVEEID